MKKKLLFFGARPSDSCDDLAFRHAMAQMLSRDTPLNLPEAQVEITAPLPTIALMVAWRRSVGVPDDFAGPLRADESAGWFR
ncbi:MAG: hypothetical protein Q7T21_08775 [Gallionella sp.]|nr:hypothetical protein [Gallionella sp.]